MVFYTPQKRILRRLDNRFIPGFVTSFEFAVRYLFGWLSVEIEVNVVILTRSNATPDRKRGANLK
jgi:hypothetical protein